MDATQLPDTDGDYDQTQGQDQDQDDNPLNEDQTAQINKALTYANLAKALQKKDEKKLLKIGRDVVEGYKIDEDSRREWMERNREYMKLATQVTERKSFPWDGAANVKYPLLTTAALQFAARAYGSLVPSLDIVKAKVIGDDPDGQMTDIANKLSTHMSYQVLYEIDDWEEDMDKLCFVLPIIGTMFKKVWYNQYDKKICIDLYSPKEIIVNYYTKKIADATRITEVCFYTVNEVKEMQNKGLWIEYTDAPFTPGTPNADDQGLAQGTTTGTSPPRPDDETPRKFLTQYCRLDLDNDGYKEPYIVTVDFETEKPVSIIANFYVDDVEYKEGTNHKEVACIHAAQWFVKYDFLPNPDGGFYGIGFGILLGGINSMINSICNQLIDAGTISNLQAGFIGRGLRDNKQKTLRFAPGEWKWVNNPGDDLKKNIFPLPVREPSATLFQLLGTLVQSGKEVASVADIMTGKMPGQNTPAQTTMATVEQGLKVFTSIYKRIYRSMGQEFCMLFDLNKMYAPSEPVRIAGKIDGQDKSYNVSRFDYQNNGPLIKVMPAADPNMVSEIQKLQKIQGLYELMQFGTINPQEMTKQTLIYQGQDNISALMKVQPPGPPPDIQFKMQELDKKMQLEQQKLAIETQRMQIEAATAQANLMVLKSTAILNLAKARQADAQDDIMRLEMELEQISHQQDMLHEHQKNMLDMRQQMMQHSLDIRKQQGELAMQNQANQADLAMNAQQHQQELAHNEQKHQQAMQHAEAMNEAKIELTKAQAKAAAKAKPQGQNAK